MTMDAYTRMVEKAREQKRQILSYPIHTIQDFTVHMIVEEIQLMYSINIKRIVVFRPSARQPIKT
jgi:hypothetical protein